MPTLPPSQPNRPEGRWKRTTRLDGLPQARQAEEWTYQATPNAPERRFRVSVEIGKVFDVLAMKGTSLGDIRSYTSFLAGTAARLYGCGAARNVLTECPACGTGAADAAEALRVFGVPYVRCRSCGHAFVREQPGPEALRVVFAESEAHSAPYTYRDAAERRIAAIAKPKLDWTIDIHQRQHGRRLARAIDVGAAGGHFLAALRREGIAGEGFELSAASRRFASVTFGITLRDDDFLSAEPSSVDLMTFWGLLEYTPEPRRFLAMARRWLAPESGLLVVEVPRFDAFSTAAQAANPTMVARHMDPTSHVNCFTDASLATALVETGFAPVAVWYFGMDAYELIVQAALRLGDDTVVARLADMIPLLQQSLDYGRQCDDLIMAAVPVAR